MLTSSFLIPAGESSFRIEEIATLLVDLPQSLSTTAILSPGLASSDNGGTPMGFARAFSTSAATSAAAVFWFGSIMLRRFSGGTLTQISVLP